MFLTGPQQQFHRQPLRIHCQMKFGTQTAAGSPHFPWPDYKTYDVPADSDHDGMPDKWETAHGLNPNDARDANRDWNGDGYTNLEKYLNGLVGEYSVTALK